MRATRREFVKWIAASGIGLSLSRLGAAQEPAFGARETLPGRGQWNPAVNAAGRIDGVVKVTGAKLYASDFRAADLPGWPANTSHALLIRAPGATHVYQGIDLAQVDNVEGIAELVVPELGRDVLNEPRADPVDVVVDAVIIQHRHLLLNFGCRLATELHILGWGVLVFGRCDLRLRPQK